MSADAPAPMTDDALRDALALYRGLGLVSLHVHSLKGAYVTVCHVSGGKWAFAVKQETLDAGPAEVAREVATAVGMNMASDAAEVLRSAVNLLGRGREV